MNTKFKLKQKTPSSSVVSFGPSTPLLGAPLVGTARNGSSIALWQDSSSADIKTEEVFTRQGLVAFQQLFKGKLTPRELNGLSKLNVLASNRCGPVISFPSTFKHSSQIQFGRRYASPPSLQGLPKRLRACISFGLLRDFDLENAYPSIIHQIASKFLQGKSFPVLTRLVTRREQLLAEVCGLLSCMRTSAKVAFIRVMHGGGYRKITGGKSCTILEHFRVELDAIGHALSDTDEYRSIATKVAANPTKYNKLGTFISYVCQIVEAQVVEVLASEFEAIGCTPRTFCFDGLLTEVPAGVFLEQAQLDLMMVRVFAATGWNLRLVEKSLDPQQYLTVDGEMDAVDADLSEGLPDDEVGSLVHGITAEDLDYGGERKMSQEQRDYDSTPAMRALRGLLPPASPAAPKSNVVFPNLFTIKSEDMITVHTPAGEDRIAMYPILFEEDVKCLAISAHMGIGKTTALVIWIRALPPSTRIIIVTCRQQQAWSTLAALAKEGLNFSNYQELNLDELQSANRLVIQWESLYKLFSKPGLKWFDVGICDEGRGILAEAVCPTNGDHLQSNFAVWEWLNRTIPKFLWSDADLFIDGMVARYLNSVYKPQQIRALQYEHVALPRVLHIASKSKWHAMVKADVEAGKKLLLVFRSRKLQMAWAELAFVKAQKLLVINKDTSDADLKRIFSHLNGALSQVNLVSITTKCLNGADMQCSFFRVYAELSGRVGWSCCARDAWQMIGRGRQVETSEVVCCLPPVSTEANPTFEQEMKRLRENKNARVNLAKDLFKADGVTYEPGNYGPGESSSLQFKVGQLVNIAAEHSAEANSCFATQFQEQALKKGYLVVTIPDDAEDQLDAKDHQQERKDATKVVTERERNAVDDIASRVLALARDHNLQRVDQRGAEIKLKQATASNAERLEGELCYFLLHFETNNFFLHIQLADFVEGFKKRDKLWRAKKLVEWRNSADDEGISDHEHEADWRQFRKSDLDKMIHSVDPEECKLNANLILQGDQLFKSAGFDNGLLDTSSFTKLELGERVNEEKFKKLWQQVRFSANLRAEPRCPGGREEILFLKLKSVINYCGLTFSQRGRSGVYEMTTETWLKHLLPFFERPNATVKATVNATILPPPKVVGRKTKPVPRQQTNKKNNAKPAQRRRSSTSEGSDDACGEESDDAFESKPKVRRQKLANHIESGSSSE